MSEYSDVATTITREEYLRREAAGTLKLNRVAFRRQVTDFAADAKPLGHIDEPKVAKWKAYNE